MLGISEEMLQFFIDNPYPPDVLGVNYYCTSERFLDEDMQKYPESRHGGNAYHEYADVEAIRVKFDEPHGFPVLMQELWDRYKLPISVTEAHLHCSREGQIKWFMEIYEAACQLKQKGMDIRAVTAWSVLGAFGWNKLLISEEMEYERGTFDISSGSRRPTAMACVIKQLAETGTYNSHVLHAEGWWNSESRYFGVTATKKIKSKLPKSCRPIVVVGKTGTLGKAFARICRERALHHVLLSRQDIDICIPEQIQNIIDIYNPWAIINAAGYVRVDQAEGDEQKCYLENTKGPQQLAEACKENGIQFMTFSSDLVFDGSKDTVYVESDEVNPLNVYGKSKAAAETAVLDANADSLIIRTSAFFGPWDKYNFATAVLQTLEDGQPFYAANTVITPTYVPHLVNAALDLLIDDEHGIWHLTNNVAITWIEFARSIAERAGLDPSLIMEDTAVLPAERPKNSALQSEKGKLMPSLDIALEEYFAEVLVYA
jgi:dTDP-4-dehydrorhamnose reductase